LPEVSTFRWYYFTGGLPGSYDFPNPNLDGVALLDDPSPYPCPACNKPLVSAIVNEVQILSCPKCRGNLIDQSKMLPIIRHAEPLAAINDDIQDPPDKAELGRSLTCPSCRKMMAAYPYGGPGNIIIQGCEPCRLIWLDFGELSRIIRSYQEMYRDSPDDPGAKKKWVAF
jgi:Zn-finger nucleic acid-binding protein